MKQRIALGRVEPAAYEALRALEAYLNESVIEPKHRHLIKLRASQINGCAYCVDMHVREALADGEEPRRLHAVVVWRETPFFSDKERAILALTEEVTRLPNGVSDETYGTAAALLGEKYLAAVIMAIIAINAWNRVGVATAMQPALGAAPAH
jgi:AhpD family alkylhydroperoxidase